MSDRKCLCQLCTCPERMHKCAYGDGELELQQAALRHCEQCGSKCKKLRQSYVPMGPIDTTTTYSSEYKPKLADMRLVVKKPERYSRPAAPMDTSTTYNADFTEKPADVRLITVKPAQYIRPMGDMQLETTYSGEFREKPATVKLVSHKPPGYKQPMGPMNFDTTYGADFTEKQTPGFLTCCPCCNPKASGYVEQGEENGHVMFVRKT